MIPETTANPPSTPERPPAALIRAAVRTVYRELDAEVASHAPQCAISGRCCRFEEYGHTLFLSEVETFVLLVDAPPPVRPLDDGATCPWQDDRGHCTARDARPLGCRVYFCDPAYEPHAPAITERHLARLKRLSELCALPWNYAPLHDHLNRAHREGRFRNPLDTSLSP